MQRNLAKRWQTPVGVSLCLLGMMGCGLDQPRVKQQPSGQVDKPEFPAASESFKLNELGEADINYEGPVIFWREAPDPEVLKDVLRQSVAIKRVDASFKELKFKQDEVSQQISGLQERVAALNSQLERGGSIEKKIDDFYAKENSKLTESFQSWFKDNLDESSADEFSTYCEGALWKIAASPFLRKFEFSSRPSPLALCEAYYGEKGFFSDPQCQLAEGEASKNFFPCFWGTSGVLKTEVTFHEVGAGEVGEETYQEIVGLFASPDWGDKLESQLRLPLLRLDDKRVAIKLGNNLLSKIVNQNLTDFLKSDANHRAVDELFVERRSTKDEPLTLHDRLFNIHRLGADKEKRELLNMGEETLTALTQHSAEWGAPLPLEDFANAEAAEREAAAALEQEREGVKAQLEEAKHKRAVIEELAAERQAAWLAAKLASGWHILDHGQAQAIYPRGLVNLAIKDDVATVSLQLDYVSGAKARGCFNLASSQAVDCPVAGGEDVATYLPLVVNIDPATSVMKLELKLADPAAFGMKHYIPEGMAEGRSEGSSVSHMEEPRYQIWEEGELAGKTLSLELAPRQYNSALSILTGKAFLYEGEQAWAEGTVSFSEFGAF